MEEKYNEFRCKWNLTEWNPTDLMLVEITDEKRIYKENKDVKGILIHGKYQMENTGQHNVL